MKTYFVLFEIPAATMDEWRRTTDPEEAKAAASQMMQAWSQWTAEHESDFVDKGAPLGKTKVVTSAGIDDARNDLCYYVVVQAESHEAAATLFADQPHLRIPSSRIQVMEIPRTPPM